MQSTKPNLEGKRILVAEYLPEVREALRIVFEGWGLEMTEADDGDVALELYQREKFDFVCTCYSMGRMKGDELAQKIKAINPQQRIVMLTGFADRVLQDGKLPPFIDLLIRKPCRAEQLAQVFA